MYQLSIFDQLPPSSTEPPVWNTANPEQAARFQALASGMQAQIDALKNSGIFRQRPTARRLRIAESIRKDARRLEKIQSWLRAMADSALSGTLPDVLRLITQKCQLEVFVDLTHHSWTDEDIAQIFSSDNAYAEKRQRLARAGIRNLQQCKAAIAALEALQPETPVDPIELQIKHLEQSLIGSSMPGWFPTPPFVLNLMMSKANVKPGMHSLELGC